MRHTKVHPLSDYDKSCVEFAKRYIDSRIQRVIGVPSRDPVIASEYDGHHLVMCPNSRIIEKFSKVTGKREKLIVPCGSCMYCRCKYQNKLIFRLYNHNRMYEKGIFVTLTYDNYHYTENVDDLRKDITLFIKRFRKELADKTFSYYMVCERGDLRNRCHFHLLMWWNGSASVEQFCHLVNSKWVARPRSTDASFTDLVDCLSLDDFLQPTSCGIVYIDTNMNTNIASYVSKYVSDKGKKLVFRSWSLGLGADILAVDDDLVSKMRYLNIIEYMPKDKVYRVGVDKYYRDKVFTRSEQDCFFADYLLSDDYSRKWEFYEDFEKFSNMIDVFKAWEKRILDKYHARVVAKAKRKRLL